MEELRAEVSQWADMGVWSFSSTANRPWQLDEICRTHFGLPSSLPLNTRTLMRRCHPDFRRRAWETLRTALTDKKPFQVDLVVFSSGGESRHLRCWGQAKQSILQGGTLLLADPPKALPTPPGRSGRLRQLLDHSSDALLVVDPTTLQIAGGNQPAAALLGFADEDALKDRYVLEFLAEEVAIPNFDRYRRLRSGETRTEEVRLIRTDGTQVWVQIVTIPVEEADTVWWAVRMQNVTASRQALAEAQRTEALLRTTERIARLGSWEVTLPGSKVKWSEQSAEVLGVPTDTPPSALIKQLPPPEQRRLRAALERLRRYGHPFDLTVLLLEARALRVVGRAARQRLYGIVQDVSDQVDTERERQRYADRYRLLADHMRDVVMITNLGGHFEYVSPSYETLLGYDPLREGRLDGLATIHPEDQERVAIWHWQIAQEAAQPRLIEYRKQHADGYYLWIESHVTVLKDARNRPERFLAVLRNVTARHEASRRLADSERNLREAQRLARAGSYELDLRTQEVRCSSELLRLCELPADAAPTVHDLIALIHPDDTERVQRRFDHVLAVGLPFYHLEYRMVQPTGAVRYVVQRGHVRYTNAEQPERVVSSIQDITEQHQYEESLTRLNEQQDRILAAVAHDLRRPMNQLSGLTALLRGEQLSPAERTSLLGMVEGSVEKSLALIDELLDLSELEDTSLRLKLQATDLTSFLPTLALEPATEADRRGLRFETKLPTTPLVVPIEPPRFARVVENLLSNAIKFTRSGGTVTLEAYPEGTKVVIAIADTGIGIPESLQPIVFDKFSKARRLGLKGEKSTGLGMSIVKQIVELHNGQIWFESAEGLGTTFFISLPTAP